MLLAFCFIILSFANTCFNSFGKPSSEHPASTQVLINKQPPLILLIWGAIYCRWCYCRYMDKRTEQLAADASADAQSTEHTATSTTYEQRKGDSSWGRPFVLPLYQRRTINRVDIKPFLSAVHTGENAVQFRSKERHRQWIQSLKRHKHLHPSCYICCR